MKYIIAGAISVPQKRLHRLTPVYTDLHPFAPVYTGFEKQLLRLRR